MRKTFLSSFITFSVLVGLSFLGASSAHAVIYVSDVSDVSIKTWDNDATGNMSPLTNISGPLKKTVWCSGRRKLDLCSQ
jgi:hypothetical protein